MQYSQRSIPVSHRQAAEGSFNVPNWYKVVSVFIAVLLVIQIIVPMGVSAAGTPPRPEELFPQDPKERFLGTAQNPMARFEQLAGLPSTVNPEWVVTNGQGQNINDLLSLANNPAVAKAVPWQERWHRWWVQVGEWANALLLPTAADRDELSLEEASPSLSTQSTQSTPFSLADLQAPFVPEWVTADFGLQVTRVLAGNTIYLPLVANGLANHNNEWVVYPDKQAILLSNDGRLWLYVPAGAVAVPTRLRYQVISAPTVEGYEAVGISFELTAETLDGQAVTQFGEALTLVVNYGELGLGDAAVQLGYGDEAGVWRMLATAVNKQVQTATAETDHFTPFALFAGNTGVCNPAVGEGADDQNVASRIINAWRWNQTEYGCPSAKVQKVEQAGNIVTHYQEFDGGAIVDSPRVASPRALFIPSEVWAKYKPAINRLHAPVNKRIAPEHFIDWGYNFREQEVWYFEHGFVGHNNGSNWVASTYPPKFGEINFEWVSNGEDPEGNAQYQLVVSGSEFEMAPPADGVEAESPHNQDGTIRLYIQDEDGNNWQPILTTTSADGAFEFAPSQSYTRTQVLHVHTEAYLTFPDLVGYGRCNFYEPTWEESRPFVLRPGVAASSYTYNCEGGGAVDNTPPEIKVLQVYGSKNLLDIALRRKIEVSVLVEITDDSGISWANAEISEGVILRELSPYEKSKYGAENIYAATFKEVPQHQTVTILISASDNAGNVAAVEADGYFANGKTFGFSCFTTSCRGHIGFKSNPVSTESGSKIEQFPLLFVQGPGLADIFINLTYNSNSIRPSIFGLAMSSDLETHLVILYNPLVDGVELVTDDGGRFPFLDNYDGTFTSLTPFNHDQLFKDGDGYRLVTRDQRTYLFDAEGRLVSKADRNGNAITYGYTGHLLTSITTGGRTVTLAYNADELVETITYAEKVITLTYQDGMLVNIQNSMDGDWVLEYEVREIGEIIDERGEEFAYEAKNVLLTSVTTPEGRVKNSQSYDDDLRVVEQTSMAGGILRFEYLTNEDGSSQTIIYDAYDQPEIHTYNSLGQLVQKTNQAGDSEYYEYNEDFLMSRKVDFGGYVWEYDRDGNGNITEIRGPEGLVLKYEYNEFNEWTWHRDGDENEWRRIFDGQGNLLEIIRPDEEKMTIGYDPRGLPIHITSYAGHQRWLTYDPVTGDMITETDGVNGQNLVTRHAYDVYGRVETTTLPLGNTWKFDYDLNDNLTDVYGAYNFHETFSYDADNLLLTYTDADKATTTYIYDDRGRLIETRNGENEPTFFTYGLMNELETIENARGAVVRYTNDELYRPIKIEMPENVTLHITYDERGNIVEMVDGRGIATATIYDGLSRARFVVENYIEDGVSNEQTNVVTEFTHDYRGNITHITKADKTTLEMAFDSVGNMVWSEDELQRRTEFGYDPDNNLTSIKRPAGDVVTMVYNGRHQLTQLTNGDGYTFEMVYNANGYLSQQIAPDGITTRLEYNELDQMTRQTANWQLGGLPLANDINITTQYEYSLAGDLLKVIDAEEYEFIFVYDKAHRLIEEINPEGTKQYRYDPVGNLAMFIDGNNHEWEYRYDLLDRVTAAINPEGHGWRYEYDEASNQTAVIDARGHRTELVYDPLNRLTTLTNPMEYVTSWEYDVVSNVTAITNGNGHTTTFEYNPAQEMTARIDPEGYRQEMEYDLNGRLSLTRIPFTNSDETIEEQYEYNGRDLLTHYTNGENETTEYVYNSVGLLQREIANDGVNTFYHYDGLRRLNGVTLNYVVDGLPEGDVNVRYQYGYDKVGNLTSITDPLNFTTRFDYNGLGSLIKETNPLDKTWEYQYDPVQNLTWRKDGKGLETTYEYYDDNQLQRIDYANDADIFFTYDENNNPLTMQDGLGGTAWTYDPLNRITEVNDSLGRTVSYTYDALNRTSLTYPDGLTVNYTYLNNNWLATATDPMDGTSTYSYDPAGRITGIDHPNNTYVERTYDRAHRLLELGNYQDGGDILSKFEYVYDEVGQRTQATNTYGWRQPATEVESYTYDNLRRLTGVDSSNGMWAVYGYDRSGNRTLWQTNDDPFTSTQNDGFTNIYTYNGANQLVSIVGDTHPGNPAPKRQDNVWQALAAFRHEVNAQAGQHISDFAATDLLAQADSLLADLAQGQVPSVAEVSAALDTLSSAVEGYSADGQIDNSGIANSLLVKLDKGEQANNSQTGRLQTTTFSYDDNGNRLNRELPGPQGPQVQGTDYAYDDENRLVQVWDYQGNNQGNRVYRGITTMAYDGGGRRLVETYDPKEGGGGIKTTEYTFDGLDPIAEYDLWNGHQRNLYRGAGNQLIQMQEFPGGTQGNQYWFHHNGHGDVAGLTKHLGQSTHNYRYDAFGGVIPATGNFLAPHNDYALTEKSFDGHTGFYYFGARHYDPLTANWLTQDTYRGMIDQPATLHRYQYVNSNPINYYDPDGHRSFLLFLQSGSETDAYMTYVSKDGGYTGTLTLHVQTSEKGFHFSKPPKTILETYSWEVKSGNPDVASYTPIEPREYIVDPNLRRSNNSWGRGRCWNDKCPFGDKWSEDSWGKERLSLKELSGEGSVFFFHGGNEGRGTAGCIKIKNDELGDVLDKLDAIKKPIRLYIEPDYSEPPPPPSWRFFSA